MIHIDNPIFSGGLSLLLEFDYRIGLIDRLNGCVKGNLVLPGNFQYHELLLLNENPLQASNDMADE